MTKLDLKSEIFSNQFMLFLTLGGLSALGSFISRIYLSFFFSYSVAIVVAYVIGMFIAFILFKWFVFKAGRSLRNRKEIIFFTSVNLAAVLQTLFFSLLLARLIFPWLNISNYKEEAGHIFGMSITAASSFIGHKYLSFRDSGDKVIGPHVVKELSKEANANP